MYLDELQKFIKRQGFRSPQERHIDEIRKSMPRCISKLLSDEQVLDYDDVKNQSLDDMIAIANTYALSANSLNDYANIQRNIVQLMKLRHDIKEPNENTRPVVLNITTRKRIRVRTDKMTDNDD